MKKINRLKQEYDQIEIPAELSGIVQQTIKEHRRKTTKKMAAGFALAASLFIASVNTSSTIAFAFSDVPVVGQLVKLITFREYNYNEGTYNADIKVPAVANLKDKALEEALNEKYLKENEALYQQFIADMKELKRNGNGHLGVDSGYEVKTDNDRILAIGRYVVATAASSSTTIKYDTIDKQKEILISLPSLFKDDSYIPLISENIKQQMLAQMKENLDKIYWVEGSQEEDIVELFESIKKEQNFYISDEGKLVISFDKYEVAPGYMGIVEFEIPTELIKDQLVSNEYIK
ncbi:MAG: DUF3298 domain-containing protein [Bacillus sp. (in: firmicutes)]